MSPCALENELAGGSDDFCGSRFPQSILSLDKSDEPFPTQLVLAGSILEIDLEWHREASQNLIDGQVREQYTTSDPRVEWALRWLLKKMQYSDSSPGSPHLNPKSWILLQELALRTPLSSVARNLSAHNFTSVLRNTLGWLQNHIPRSTVSTDVEFGNENPMNPPEDSSDTMKSSSSERETSKKRKLDGIEVVTSEEVGSTAIGGYRVLYLVVCGTVRQLESLTMDPEGIQGFAVEYMKSSLKSSPEDAARILGNSFYLANRIIQTPEGRWRQNRVFTWESHKPLADAGYRSCLEPVIDFWNRRSVIGKHSSTSSNGAFMACCMLPTLQLLDTCKQRPTPTEDMAEVIKSLEGLLREHIVLPLRSSYLGLKPAAEIEEEVSFTSFSDRLVSLLRGFLPLLERSSSRADWKTNKHLALSIISLLFDVAIGCRPRHNAKLRRLENAWLEQLFVKLVKCAENLFPPVSSIKAQKDSTRVIKWMLRKAVDHQVQLSLSTIKALLDQASGLFQDTDDGHTETRADVGDDNRIEWGLISLCILNDSNTFVIPSSSPNDNETFAYRPPNKYLSALLREITHEVCYQSSQEDRDYDFRLLHVLQPLCCAFIAARDLTGFLEHWREQLSIVQKQQESKGKLFDLIPSIWEDERLLLYVARSVESSLTAGQIDRVLSTAARGLSPSIPDIVNHSSISLASLMVLDCVCTGLVKDEMLVKLESIAVSVFSLLGEFVLRPSNLSSPYRWRVWKIKGTITDRWPSLRDSLEFKRAVHPAICVAFELINRISSELTLRDNVALTEELFAVKFMCRFVAMEDSLWEDPHFSSRRNILSAVDRILDIMEPFCHRIRHDLFGVMLRSDAFSKSEQSSVKISPIDDFYFDCIHEIIESPDVLSYLDTTTQHRLVQQLYWSSVFQQRFGGSESGLSIIYSRCWEKLSRYDALDENKSMTRCLRTFQVDRFLSTSEFGEPKYWDVGAADYTVAFRSIQSTPTIAFNREQRIKLANRILRILLFANMSELARTTDHLILMAKLIQMPNKSIKILTNENEIPRKGLEKPDAEIALISLARGIDGVVGWSEDTLHSVRALGQLARLVMSYLFSTLDQKSSIQYLQMFYGQISHSLEVHHKNDTTCTIALSALFEQSLNQFSRHREELGDFLKPVELDTTRQYHLESILKSFDGLDGTSLNEAGCRHSCGVSLECLVGYSDLLAIHPNLQNISHQLFSRDGPFRTIKALGCDGDLDKAAMAYKGHCSIDYLAVCLAKVELHLYTYDHHLHPKLAGILESIKSFRSPREKNNLVGHFKDTMPRLDLQLRKQLCFDIHVDQQDHLDYSKLLQIRVGISSLNDQQVGELGDDLSRLLILLCRGFARRAEFSACMLSMQCVNTLLQNHTRVVRQWHIDELLAAIAIKASCLGSQTEKHSGRLYIGLCRLCGTILADHRAKIGGRFHLVLLTLQALLRCLFIPYNNSESVGSEGSMFGESHATAYGRILNMICDPTVSSVKRSRNKSRLELNDETKKARSIAGQHLPYLIMEFCGCQLRGRLLPGMRAALNSGLYAALAIVPPEMMRTMNAAMDSDSRSIFKSLYDDYRRFGRWKGG